MKSLVYTMSVETFVPMLGVLSNLLDKGAEHATAKKFDPAVLVNARLAPDMFSLARQVKITCDQANIATALFMGQEPPRSEDDEETLDALKARVARTIDYLRNAQASAFEGAEDRDIKIPLGTDLVLEMKGLPFLRDWVLPNFYFHIVTAYDILRHNGVDVGKRDFLSHTGSSIRQRGEQEK